MINLSEGNLTPRSIIHKAITKNNLKQMNKRLSFDANDHIMLVFTKLLNKLLQ